MTALSHARGWPIKYDEGERQWVYVDAGEPVDDRRSCMRCGREPTAEGYDACLGFIEGATSACCGHGESKRRIKCLDGF